MTYGEVHRFILRSIASRGVMSLSETETALHNFCRESDPVQVSVRDLVKEINEEIRPYQQNLRITLDEQTDEHVIIFLSLGFDEATKSQGIFSEVQLNYFRVLIEQIMNIDTRQITAIHALNLVSQLQGSFSKADAQKLLHIWCRMRYLDKEGDNYVLGIRAIHEFESYLRQNMPDAIEECFLCKKIVFRGYNCPSANCGKAIHTLCLNKYMEQVKKWPCCSIEFSEAQLEQMQYETSRLTQIQTNRSQANETQAQEPSTVQEAEQTAMSEEMEVTQDSQDIVLGVSQRITRKRKRNA